jgi:Uma2 family endonuclease
MVTDALLDLIDGSGERSIMAETIVVAPPETHSTKLMTAEELWAIAGRGRYELVRGRLIAMSPTSGPHGRTENRVAHWITSFVDERELGEVYVGETGFLIARDPDTVRGADIAFLTKEHAAQVPSTGYVPFAPDLVVEVVSPDDLWSEVQGKVNEWLAAGAPLVWVFDPQRKSIDAFTPERHWSLKEGDALTGDEVLPGFSVPLSKFFP